MEERIIQGDCLEVLKTLADCSVDMCVTSPPYYGLRDYGTGKWIGGDPNCPHRRVSKRSDKTITGHKQAELEGNVGDAIYKTVCPLCGAVREDRQIGLEETPEEYVEKLVLVFREVRRVLKDDGTLWLNIGDSYAGSGRGPAGNLDKENDPRNMTDSVASKAKVPDSCKPKDLIGIPWMLAFALRRDGWYLRQDIIWAKPNPMPESVKDRCTKSHEYVFLFSKSNKYYFNNEAIQEDAITHEQRPCGVVREREYGYESKRNLHPEAYQPKTIRFGGNKYGDNNDKKFAIYSGNEWVPSDKRNKRDVWTIPAQPTKEAHFATFPEALVEPCILAGCRPDGVVLDPFFGSGTTGRVALKHGRGYIGVELNPEYIEIEKKRLDGVQTALF